MIGIRGSHVVALMACYARRVGQAVVRRPMALAAQQRRVRPGKWPPGRVVIERRRRPCGGAVAHFALLRQPARLMVGIGSGLVIGQMAAHAGVDLKLVVPLVTLVALQVRMRARQGEP